MSTNRLNIVAEESKSPATATKRRREEAKEKYDLLWQTDPEQFNPLRNCMGRERVSRTWRLIEERHPEGLHFVDLGCGSAIFSKRLCKHKAYAHAVDIASIPLKLLDEQKIENLTTSQDYVPRTILNDNAYDAAIGTDLIADLPADEYRLFMSELSRIIKPSGFVICSTDLDINSEDALQRFANLAETEFQIEKWEFSYHYLYIRLLNFLRAPANYARAKQDPEFRSKELAKRFSISHWWFSINSSPLLGTVWSGVQYLFRPIVKFVGQSHSLMNGLEKISRFLWTSTGISHAIFIGTRRPIAVVPPPDKAPIERKQKRQVWE